MRGVRDIMKWGSFLLVFGVVGTSVLASSAFVTGCSSNAEPTLNPQPLPPVTQDPNPNDPNQGKNDQTGSGGPGGGGDNGNGSATSAPSAPEGGAEGGADAGGG